MAYLENGKQRWYYSDLSQDCNIEVRKKTENNAPFVCPHALSLADGFADHQNAGMFEEFHQFIGNLKKYNEN